jgi:hypothetical protein
MDTAPTSLAEGDARSQARRGLAVFFAVLVPLTAIFQAIAIATGNASWIFALMWSPAAASVVARLALREGFADVSTPRAARSLARCCPFLTAYVQSQSRTMWPRP